MSDLNSVLLEGTLLGGLCVTGEGKETRCFFVVSSVRTVPQQKHVQETRIGVVIRDICLVKAAERNARCGRGIRVVGWLVCNKLDNRVYIEAEHVEYRPELSGKKRK